MQIEHISVFAALMYKIVCILSGTVFAYLGYCLFTLGVWGKAGSMELNYKDSKLLLRSAAPGTFFVVLGALIIAATILARFDVSSVRTDPSPSAGAAGEGKPSLP